MKNMFTLEDALHTEAEVERHFACRLIDLLGFPDNEVRLNESIERILLVWGKTREPYRPDIVLTVNQIPCILIEVKAPKVELDYARRQVRGYALMINQRSRSYNPVKYCIVTNGLETCLFYWDSVFDILRLEFEDWRMDNPKVKWLIDFLHYRRFREDVWSLAGKPGSRDPLLEAQCLLQYDGISLAAVSRLLYLSKNHPRPFAAALEHPWHRKAYKELADLNWIAPLEEMNRAIFLHLTSDRERSGENVNCMVMFKLTPLGENVVKIIHESPDLTARFRNLIMDFPETPIP